MQHGEARGVKNNFVSGKEKKKKTDVEQSHCFMQSAMSWENVSRITAGVSARARRKKKKKRTHVCVRHESVCVCVPARVSLPVSLSIGLMWLPGGTWGRPIQHPVSLCWRPSSDNGFPQREEVS